MNARMERATIAVLLVLMIPVQSWQLARVFNHGERLMAAEAKIDQLREQAQMTYGELKGIHATLSQIREDLAKLRR